MKLINQDMWMQGLSDGWLDLEVDIHTSGFGTYEYWSGFQNRQLDYYVIYFLVGGGIDVTLHDSNQNISIRSGSFFMLSPNVRHTVSLSPPHTSITPYHFRLRSYMSGGRRCQLANELIYIRSAQFLRPDVARLYDTLKVYASYRKERLRALWTLFFAEVFNRQSADTQSLLSVEQQTTINQYIVEHVVQRPSPSDLAAVIGLSPDYFARVFKQTYGVSPRTRLLHERIQVASATLLETQKTITHIAEDLGYTDIYLFSRQFKQVVGCSPRQFRQRHYSSSNADD